MCWIEIGQYSCRHAHPRSTPPTLCRPALARPYYAVCTKPKTLDVPILGDCPKCMHFHATRGFPEGWQYGDPEPEIAYINLNISDDNTDDEDDDEEEDFDFYNTTNAAPAAPASPSSTDNTCSVISVSSQASTVSTDESDSEFTDTATVATAPVATAPVSTTTVSTRPRRTCIPISMLLNPEDETSKPILPKWATEQDETA
ncbi:hypothetical protein ABW21_db0202789 [Orbilia brochopaga]|nr:hypothetical protein ABW21_db0202789 [Drechslerella brochopaga]